MANSLESQKNKIVDEILELNKRLNALKYLLNVIKEKEKPEYKVAIDVYDEFFTLLHKLLWDSIVINLYWLYDKKGQRNLFWYLNQIEVSDPKAKVKIDIQLERVNTLTTEIDKVKKFRDKAIAHRDKKTFEESEEFWKKEERLNIQEVEMLVKTASEIMQEHFPIVDLTTSGIQKIFGLISLIVHKNPDFLRIMKDYGVIEKLGYSDLHTLCQQLKEP